MSAEIIREKIGQLNFIKLKIFVLVKKLLRKNFKSLRLEANMYKHTSHKGLDPQYVELLQTNNKKMNNTLKMDTIFHEIFQQRRYTNNQ